MSGSHNWSNKALAQPQVFTVTGAHSILPSGQLLSKIYTVRTVCHFFLGIFVRHKKKNKGNWMERSWSLVFLGNVSRWGQLLMSPCLPSLGRRCWTGASTQCTSPEGLIKHCNLIYSNTALISTHQFSTWMTCLTFIITWLIKRLVVSYTAQPHTSEEPPATWPGCSDTQICSLHHWQVTLFILNSDGM